MIRNYEGSMAAASFSNVPTPQNVLKSFEDWAVLAKGNALPRSPIPTPTTYNEEEQITFVAAVLKGVKETDATYPHLKDAEDEGNVANGYLRSFEKLSKENAAFAQKILDRLAKEKS